MLTRAEHKVLEVFREYLVSPGEMLCFHGPQLQKYKAPLRQLIEKKFVFKEQFQGGYSLTKAGYDAMHASGDHDGVLTAWPMERGRRA